MKLPANHKPYIDKYFLRAKIVLKDEGHNPRIEAQVFIRNGEAKVYGIKEAIEIFRKYTIASNCLEVHALRDGDDFESCEPIMKIKGFINNIIDLETMYLGVISAKTTIENDKQDIDLKNIERNMSKIVELAEKRPVSYFGARHWSWDRDAAISKACFDAGAISCSTDIGAGMNKQEGIGTIPHALEAIYHDRYGIDKAVVESTIAFDAVMNEDVPRIALIDYANREIQDTIAVANALDMIGNRKLDAIRIDTCGENIMQSGMYMTDNSRWFGKGVSISGVYNVRKALDYSGFNHVKIILSSGFGNPSKVEEFIKAEKILKTRLFDGLGVGGVFHSRMATMDIVKIMGKEISKSGRKNNKSNRLVKMI